ncbi:MAG: hypothetical protein FGM37_05730 [Phycisphaerales bacterium]|nr:hypothetical protein [Phycisphaerales bacterium]
MKLHLALAASIATLALAGCGDTGSRTTKVTPKPPPTEKIKSPDAEFEENHKLESTSSAPPGTGAPGAKPAPKKPS